MTPLLKHEYFEISDRVKKSLNAGKPVLALESAIISFGLPPPANLSTALECEKIATEEGVEPATIGIVDGILKLGITKGEIESFATRTDIIKSNLANISVVCASGKWGATSVSTSLLAASRSGIHVFATGGIGGVHRGFGNYFDISSDLTALGKLPTIVVSSGVKSILDVRATREHLETLGIPVIGYGTDTFPVFYCAGSSHPVDFRANTPEEIVKVYQAHQAMNRSSAILVAVPVPAEDGLSPEELEQAMNKAEEEMKKRDKVQGRAVTPFLLGRLAQITQGKTLQANISLVKNNVYTGSQIARALATSIRH